MTNASCDGKAEKDIHDTLARVHHHRFGASIWLYTVLKDATSMVMMAVFLVALIWYGFNVKSLLKKTDD